MNFFTTLDNWVQVSLLRLLTSADVTVAMLVDINKGERTRLHRPNQDSVTSGCNENEVFVGSFSLAHNSGFSRCCQVFCRTKVFSSTGI